MELGRSGAVDDAAPAGERSEVPGHRQQIGKFAALAEGARASAARDVLDLRGPYDGEVTGGADFVLVISGSGRSMELGRSTCLQLRVVPLRRRGDRADRGTYALE